MCWMPSGMAAGHSSPPARLGRRLEVVLAAYKSALTGRPVDLPLRPDDPFYDGVLAALDPAVSSLPVD